jgi:hypothetical protein
MGSRQSVCLRKWNLCEDYREYYACINLIIPRELITLVEPFNGYYIPEYVEVLQML